MGAKGNNFLINTHNFKFVVIISACVSSRLFVTWQTACDVIQITCNEILVENYTGHFRIGQDRPSEDRWYVQKKTTLTEDLQLEGKRTKAGWLRPGFGDCFINRHQMEPNNDMLKRTSVDPLSCKQKQYYILKYSQY